MMIESIMLVALGFLMASLLTLVFYSAVWNRAVRLTYERIKATMPISLSEMQADKDQLRAEFAVTMRQFEVKLEHANLKAARQLIEISRNETEITKLKTEMNVVHTQLEEERNANNVLKQTVSTRIPQMEAQLLKAKEMLGVRYQEITRLRSTISKKEGELGEIRSVEQKRQAEIQRLKSTIETQDTSSKATLEDYEKLKASDNALHEEIKSLKLQLKEAHLNAETQAKVVQNEMHRLSNRIIDLSSSKNSQPSNLYAMPLPQQNDHKKVEPQEDESKQTESLQDEAEQKDIEAKASVQEEAHQEKHSDSNVDAPEPENNTAYGDEKAIEADLQEDTAPLEADTTASIDENFSVMKKTAEIAEKNSSLFIKPQQVENSDTAEESKEDPPENFDEERKSEEASKSDHPEDLMQNTENKDEKKSTEHSDTSDKSTDQVQLAKQFGLLHSSNTN